MNKKRILIIDDESSFTRMVKLNLECLGGYAVLEVNRPHEALRGARTFQPDLILLDVIMPGVDGGEVAAKLRADPQLCGVPIVFLTATVSLPEAGRSGLNSGGFLFLAKPVALADLIACITRQLDAQAVPAIPSPAVAGARQSVAA